MASANALAFLFSLIWLYICSLMNQPKPHLHTILSPKLLELYDVSDCIVVVIDVFRATSTIATALYMVQTVSYP